MIVNWIRINVKATATPLDRRKSGYHVLRWTGGVSVLSEAPQPNCNGLNLLPVPPSRGFEMMWLRLNSVHRSWREKRVHIVSSGCTERNFINISTKVLKFCIIQISKGFSCTVPREHGSWSGRRTGQVPWSTGWFPADPAGLVVYVRANIPSAWSVPMFSVLNSHHL